MANVETPCERRSGEPFKSPMTLGAMVHIIRFFSKNPAPPLWQDSFRSSWKGDTLVAEMEELVILDASELEGSTQKKC